MPRTAQLATFIAMVLSVLGAVHWSVWVRLVVDPAPPAALRRGLTLALIVLFLGIPLTFYFARLRDLAARRFLTMPGYVWLGAVFILLVLIVSTDLVRLTGAAVERLVADVPPSDPEPSHSSGVARPWRRSGRGSGPWSWPTCAFVSIACRKR